MDPNNKSDLKVHPKLIEWIFHRIRTDFKWLRPPLLKGLRFAWRHHPGPRESSSKVATAYPTGPYAANPKPQTGDLLLWVPRHIESFIIDDLTGGFGYSHCTVDTGEVDLPTGKPVMVEISGGRPVERKFQDEYPNRAFARIPLSKTGVDTEAFVACVLSRLGESYDNLEALTLGEIDDPAKQVCSSLVTECLPEVVRREIANKQRLGLLRRASVSVHSPSKASKTKVFTSPNGFAQYYGAPQGRKLHEVDYRVEPHPMETSLNNAERSTGWKSVLLLAAAGMLTASCAGYFYFYRPPKIRSGHSLKGII